MDGERGLVGERRQEGDLVAREPSRALRVDVERADRLVVDAQRHSQEAVKALLQRGALARGIEADVFVEIFRHDRLAGGHDPAAQALSDLDPRTGHEGGRRLRPGRHHEILPLPQPDAGSLRSQQPTRLLDEEGEEGIRVVDRGQLPGQSVEDVQAASLPLALPEASSEVGAQAGVVAEQGPALEHPPRDDPEASQVNGLDDAPRGAAVPGSNRPVEGAGLGKDEHLAGPPGLPRFSQDPGVVHVPGGQAKKDEGHRGLANHAKPLPAGPDHPHRVALPLEKPCRLARGGLIVVDDQDALRIQHDPPWRASRRA